MAAPAKLEGSTTPRRAAPLPLGPAAALTALLCIAALLRVARPDLVSFTADEGIHGIGAMEIAVFDGFPMVGLPSVGIRNSALFLYTLAVPFFFWSNPISGVLFVVAINLLGMAYAFRIGRRAFGDWPAVAGVALLTFSPWGIIYSRNMWPPSCVMLPCLALIDATLAWLADGRRSRLFWMVVLAFVCPQMHFSGFCAPVWLLAALWTGRQNLALGPLVGGAVVGLATWGPWLYWQHFINRWQDIAQLLRNAKGTTTLGETIWASCDWWGKLLGSNGFDYWFGPEIMAASPAHAHWVLVANEVVSWLLIPVGVGAVVWSIRQRVPSVRLLALWSILPVGMLAALRPVVHPHYVWVAYPMPFVLVGGLLGAIVRAVGPRSTVRTAYAIAAGIAVVASLQCAFLLGWFRFLQNDGPTGAGHFQLSLRQRQLVVASIIEDWRTTNADGVSGLFSGEQPAYGFLFHRALVVQRMARRPTDESCTYWVDEEKGDAIGAAALATLRNWKRYPNPKVIKQWRIGSSRVFLVRRS